MDIAQRSIQEENTNRPVYRGPVAQWLERWSYEPQVVGSMPTRTMGILTDAVSPSMIC
jgi:hypothetical protein